MGEVPLYGRRNTARGGMTEPLQMTGERRYE
jgi:hypothetical protein